MIILALLVFILVLYFTREYGDHDVAVLERAASGASMPLKLIRWSNGYASQIAEPAVAPRLEESVSSSAISIKSEMDSTLNSLYNYVVLRAFPTTNIDTTVLDGWVGGFEGDDGTDALWDKESVEEGDNLLNWHTNCRLLPELSMKIIRLCQQYTNIANTEMYLNADAGAAIDIAFEKCNRAIMDWPYKACTFPWGNNWYQFTVNYPLQMWVAIVHLHTVGKKIKDRLNKYIGFMTEYVKKMYTSPVQALGWKRTGSNTILQGAAFCIGHYFLGDLDSFYGQTDFDYMITQCNIVMVLEGEGLRPDYGWVFHTFVRAFGYLSESIAYAEILNSIGIINNYGNVFDIVSTIMCHPTINANLPGIFARTPDIERKMNPGRYGVDRQYSCSIVSIKKKEYFMQLMGADVNLASYEADAANNTELPLWAFLREMWVDGDFVRQYDPTSNIVYCPGNHIADNTNFAPLVWKSTSSTTTAMAPYTGVSGDIYLEDADIYAFLNIQSFQATKTNPNSIITDSSAWPYTFMDGKTIIEFQFVHDLWRYCVYFYQGSDDSALNALHVAEVGIIARQVDDHTFVFTNKKRLEIITGDLQMREVEFESVAPDGKTRVTRSETVFLLSPIRDPSTKLVNSDHIHMVAYRVGLVDEFPPTKIIVRNRVLYNLTYVMIDQHFFSIFNRMDGVGETNNRQYMLYVNTDTDLGKLVNLNRKMESAHSFNLPMILYDFPVNWFPTPVLRDVPEGKTTQMAYLKDNKFSYYTGDFNFELDIMVDRPQVPIEEIDLTNNYASDIKQFPDPTNVSLAWLGHPDPTVRGDISTEASVAALREKYNLDVPIDTNDWVPFSLESAAAATPPIVRQNALPQTQDDYPWILRQSPSGLYSEPASEREYYNNEIIIPHVALEADEKIGNGRIVLPAAGGSGQLVTLAGLSSGKVINSVYLKGREKKKRKLK